MVRYIIRERHPDRLVWVTIRKTLIWPVSVSSTLCCDWSVSLPEQWAVLCGTICSFPAMQSLFLSGSRVLNIFSILSLISEVSYFCVVIRTFQTSMRKNKKRKNSFFPKMLALFSARLGCNWALASSLCVVKSSGPAHLQCNGAKLKSQGLFYQSPPCPLYWWQHEASLEQHRSTFRCMF